MLFGADSNRNGVIDPGEQQTMLTDGTAISLGWSAYLTVYSLESNKRADGTPRINVNADDLETLYADLSAAMGNDDWASFIVAFRIAGQPGASLLSSLTGGSGDNGAPTSNQVSQSEGGETTTWTADVLDQMDLSGGGGTQLTQILDLVGATVQVDGRTYASPFVEGPIAMALYMPALMGNLSTQDFETMPGRININECPAELIRGIPLISAEAADAIIQARGQESDTENRQFETWPLVEGLITIDEMRLLIPIVTSGGDVYRAQVIGYFEGKNASSRAEVVVDATTVNPKVIYWRNLSHLGRGFDVAVLGVRSQDAMQAMTESAQQN